MATTGYQKGLMAENVAKGFFTLKGYTVLAQRFKTRVGEVDLVLHKNNTLVFVEVKMRQTIENAAESITPRNQRRVLAAAELYLQQHPQYTGCDVRFDALVLAPYTLPQHIENAWGI